mmetsp:Transcript_133488/g.198445  ORF Transcript_133488/g.198445 Transcript_133488/m.198445 type:complete len:109 (-) Transcript_133488:21-347(-)
MGKEASTLMGNYLKEMNTDPEYARNPRKQTKTLTKLFEAIDDDKSGSIDGKEIKVLTKQLKKSFEQVRKRKLKDIELNAILSHSDHDRDGTIDFKEFCQMMNAVAALQ